MQELEAAFEHLGGLHQARRLLAKLERGERIIAVGIGSSFIATNSGCWQVRVNWRGLDGDVGILIPSKSKPRFKTLSPSLPPLQASMADLTALHVDLNPTVYPQPGQEERLREFDTHR